MMVAVDGMVMLGLRNPSVTLEAEQVLASCDLTDKVRLIATACAAIVHVNAA